MLPETEMKGGAILAEKLRRKVEGEHYVWEGEPLHVTLTFGVSEFDEDDEVDEVVKRADEALYAGKCSGRNRVFVNPSKTRTPRQHSAGEER